MFNTLFAVKQSKLCHKFYRYAKVGEEIRHREVVRVSHGTSDESVRRRIRKGRISTAKLNRAIVEAL